MCTEIISRSIGPFHAKQTFKQCVDELSNEPVQRLPTYSIGRKPFRFYGIDSIGNAIIKSDHEGFVVVAVWFDENDDHSS